ncbi:unknown [Feldmannia species virus]|uniref:Uncharacterized protein n=1 Tax=Feldmannia species virus TaxID=39420 RepID=B5LWH0_9PHYC|nr:hypothetical protein FeldSpV_gp081 [Feldmannia species virus]ACH46833.1 unknown [Feldmannia species virus]
MNGGAEHPSHAKIFDIFRQGGSDHNVDWVKAQVYGEKFVPEAFPPDAGSFRDVLRRLGLVPGV